MTAATSSTSLYDNVAASISGGSVSGGQQSTGQGNLLVDDIFKSFVREKIFVVWLNMTDFSK